MTRAAQMQVIDIARLRAVDATAPGLAITRKGVGVPSRFTQAAQGEAGGKNRRPLRALVSPLCTFPRNRSGCLEKVLAGIFPGLEH